MKKYMKPKLVLIIQPESALMAASQGAYIEAKKRQEPLPMEDDFDSLPSWEDMSEEYKGQNLWDD